MIVLKSFLAIIVGLCLVVSAQNQSKKPIPNRPPVITKFASSAPSLLFCPGGGDNVFCERSNRKTVTLSVEATDPEKDNLTYEYTASAGEILGTGTTVTWRLTGQKFGTQTATVRVADAHAGEATAIVNVSVQSCTVCGIYDPPCPIISVSSYSKEAYRGEQAIFKVDVTPGYFLERPDYNWTVERGKIIKGQHRPQVLVEATGDLGSEVVASVSVDGLDRACSKTASSSLLIKP